MSLTSMGFSRRLLLTGGGAALAGCAGVTAVPENRGSNANIAHWARGSYVYRTIKDGRVRGVEEWRLFTHKDGSRTMIMWHDVFARHSQFTSVLRVAADFRPLEAYVSYWTEAGFKGSGFFVVREGGLTGMSSGTAGSVTQRIDMAEPFSISTHPIASDGWHGWYYDRAKGGVQNGRYFSIEASSDLSQPVSAKLMQSRRELLGEETIDLPAGRFTARHFNNAQSGETWIGTEDSLVLRMSFPASDREYVMDSYERGTSPLAASQLNSLSY